MRLDCGHSVVLGLILSACSPEFDGLPMGGACRELEVLNRGLQTVTYVFQNPTASPVALPQVKAGCGCLSASFDKASIPARGTASLNIDFAMSYRGLVEHTVKLTWEACPPTELYFLARSPRLRGVDASISTITVSEWKRATYLLVGVIADYFPDVSVPRVPVLTVSLDRSPYVYEVRSAEMPMVNMISADICIPFPIGPVPRHIEIGSPGLAPFSIEVRNQ